MPVDQDRRVRLVRGQHVPQTGQDAVDHLITSVRKDRKWNDDGARKQLVQFFEAWGPADAATVDGRKRLSSILFA